MFGTTLYILIIGLIFILSWKRQGAALAGVLCMFGLEQWGQASSSFFVSNQSFTNILIGILIIFSLMAKVIKGNSIFVKNKVYILVIVFFLYSFTTIFWASKPYLLFQYWENSWIYLFTFILLSPLLITSIADLKYCIYTYIGVSALLSIFMLFFVDWDSRWTVLGEGGARGNPLAIAHMASNTMLAVLLTNVTKNKIWWLAKWIVLGVCVVLIVKSGSRGQLIFSSAVALALWPLSKGMSNYKGFIIAGVLVFLFGVVIEASINEFNSENTRWTQEKLTDDLSSRFELSLVLLKMASKSVFSILLGIGNSSSYNIIGTYPHIVPLEILAEEGLVGFCMFIYLVIRTFKASKQSFLYTKNNNEIRGLITTLGAFYSLSFLLSLKQGSMLGSPYLFMFMIIVVNIETVLKKQHQYNSR